MSKFVVLIGTEELHKIMWQKRTMMEIDRPNVLKEILTLEIEAKGILLELLSGNISKPYITRCCW